MFKKGFMKSVLSFLGVIFVLGPANAFAANTAGTMGPLDTTLMRIEQDITGFWAYTLVTIALVVAGVMFAMGESGQTMKKLGGIVMGGAIALGSAQMITAVFGGVGALIH